MSKQYYFKNNACQAPSHEHHSCICWHTQGAGPFPSDKPGDTDSVPTWRDQPSDYDRAMKQQRTRINASMANTQQPSAGVVLPERVPYETPGSEYFHGYNAGWAAGLDKVARLNQPCDGVNWKAVAGEQKTIIEGLQARLNQPCECVAVPSLSAIEAAFDEACGGSGSAVPIGEPLYSISLSEAAQAIRTLLAAAPSAQQKESE